VHVHHHFIANLARLKVVEVGVEILPLQIPVLITILERYQICGLLICDDRDRLIPVF